MKMIDILMIEKGGNVKELSLKKCVAEDFYKKAGLKKADGFTCLHTWDLEKFQGSKYNISIYGKKEGRTIPDSSSGNIDGTSVSSLTADDYQYLCKHNECSTFSNRTTRWASKTINVYSHNPALYTGLQGNWPVAFNLGATGGITIRYGSGGWCGAAYPVKYRDGTIRQCLILINVRHDELSCGSQISTVIHELGHCIGFFAHTTDEGIMDAMANGAAGTNATVRNMISLLYSLPPGTDISSRMRSYSRKGGDKYQPNNAQMRPIKAYYRNSRH